MKTASMKAVPVMAAALMLIQICFAQQVEPSGGRGADTDAWRMVDHNGQWWYFHPNGSWSSWDGARWNAYQPATQKTSSNGATAATNPSRPSVTNRHKGDVEVSGAELGLGVGANANSGLSNNPGAVINGKGGIGGTKTGAGLPGVGTGVRLPPSGTLSNPNLNTGGTKPRNSTPNRGLDAGGVRTTPGATGNAASPQKAN
jgi:hypothetical protein